MIMISTEQATEALKNAAVTEKRSRAAYSYSQSAPYFFVWGTVWLLGYGAEALVPLAHLPRSWTGWCWTGLSIAGAAACIIIGRKQALRNGRPAWRAAVLFLIIWLYFFASFSVLPPHSEQQVGAYIPLLFAAIYSAIGLWLGLRYILVGAFMAAATLGAYFLLHEYFFFWMALVGGGSLILTGFWLRRA
jgi:hypothetical protein